MSIMMMMMAYNNIEEDWKGAFSYHGCRVDRQSCQLTSSPQYLSQHIVAHQRTQHSIVVRPTAVRAISTDIICQTIVQHCRTSDLELIATCCVKLRLSLYFQIQT